MDAAGLRADWPVEALDDEDDRDELRRRYYGLLQELRVLLPGVQILVAFLLTAPFSNRFDRLDRFGQELYGVALVAAVLAVIAFTTPTVFHRVGPRRSRGERLEWGIRLTRIGLFFLGLSLVAATVVVMRLVFGSATAAVVGVSVTVILIGSWIVLPRRAAHHRRVHPS